ncbi:hypothetical protein ACFO6R_05880 [Eubacterium multiforme]|uniref:Uncharacterized protein n=1 Tax=Eubacterium multiforme TaxID=83339 RepID=A0ABT9US20_9FIRM|nr:hypothetical protein [Eubacterium multiforme]MDQ0149112.1 hypothetical protein [Eubacterium multiforme]
MTAILYFLAIIACFIFYINHVAMLKAIKNNKSTTENTIIGCFCILIIYIAVITF